MKTESENRNTIGRNDAGGSSETPDFLWEGILPDAGIVTLVGIGGCGKTSVAMAFAAHITNGKPFPGQGDDDATRGTVIYISADEDIETTVAGRAMAAGCDLKKIRLIRETDLSEAFKGASRVVDESGDVRLLVLDTTRNINGWKRGLHRYANVRKVLEPFHRLAREHRICVLLIAHISKIKDISGDGAIRGSAALADSSSIMLLAARMPGDDATLHVAACKSDLGPEMRFSVVFSTRYVTVPDDFRDLI